MAKIPYVGEDDAPTPDEVMNHAARVLDETVRQRDKMIHRVRELENRANLVAGLAQHQPNMQGQFRAAVFILTGSWPNEEVAEPVNCERCGHPIEGYPNGTYRHVPGYNGPCPRACPPEPAEGG